MCSKAYDLKVEPANKAATTTNEATALAEAATATATNEAIETATTELITTTTIANDSTTRYTAILRWVGASTKFLDETDEKQPSIKPDSDQLQTRRR